MIPDDIRAAVDMVAQLMREHSVKQIRIAREGAIGLDLAFFPIDPPPAPPAPASEETVES